MSNQTFEISNTPIIDLEADADLSLIGWDRAQLQANCDDAHTEFTGSESDGPIRVRTHGDCTLFLPHGARVRATVGGDLRVENITRLEATVGGDLTARDVGELTPINVGGDLIARTSTLVAGDRTTAVGGDAIIKVSGANDPITLAAGGDIQLDVSNRTNVSLRLISSSGIREMNQGSGGAKLTFTAGGDIHVHFAPGYEQSETHSTSPNVDFGDIMSSIDGWVRSENIQGMARDLSEKLRFKFERTFNKVRERAEREAGRAADRARRETDRVSERARREMDRARHRAERAASQGTNWAVNWGMDGSGGQRSGAGTTVGAVPSVEAQIVRANSAPVAAGELVSDQERLMILKMVEDKKITIEQAEQLLAALE